jgi:hypothetical protein
VGVVTRWATHSSLCEVYKADDVDIIDTKTLEVDELRKRVFCDALSWTEEEGGSVIVGGKDNRVVGPSPLAPPASPVVYPRLSSFFFLIDRR